MKIIKNNRKFFVGKNKNITLTDVGSIFLKDNENITFKNSKKMEYDICKKNWGYYGTPSLNKRLDKFGFIGAFVKNKALKTYAVMIVDKGKKKLSNYKNIKWVISRAEKLPFQNNLFDYYTISFGLRNTENLNKSLSEAYRVLKPGGRFFCLEFSKIQNEKLKFIYEQYSKLIPIIGKYVVGQKEPYEYLVKSIEKFINQEELLDLMKKNNFENCSYRNLSNGIVSIHNGWKI